MKKFLASFLVIVICFSCDDGNVEVQEINFETVVGAVCNQTIYKIKGNEILFFKITENKNAFINDQTKKNDPLVYTIDSKNPVTYRLYSSSVTAANVCDAGIATPSLMEEWTAIGGTIEITTTISKTITETTSVNPNKETIDGYNSFVIFKNVTFKKPTGEQFYEEFRFGNYKNAYTPLDFNVFNTQTIEKCGTIGNDNLTIKNGITSMISFDNSDVNLIKPLVTTVGSPRTTAISATNNLYFRLFNGNLNTDAGNYKCAKTFATTDATVLQEWKAVSGIISVETTKTGIIYTHKITLIGVKLKKGNSEFSLGDKFFLGTLEI